MKRFFSFIYICCFFALTLLAQPRLSSNKETHKFGQIEWKHPVKVEYVITNTGNQPLVLSNVTTSCACTVADWTKTPIAPGEKGTVSAIFDAEALGHFEKSIGIYSNAAPYLAYLKFTGEVVREVKDFSKTHPYQIGKIKMDLNELAFPDVYRGDKPQLKLSLVNLSDKPYEPVLMHLPYYLKIEKDPAVILKGKKGTVTLTLDTEQLPDLGLTHASVYLSRFSGDKVGEENEIPLSVVLLPRSSSLTESERAKAPVIQLSETDLDFSEELTKNKKVSHKIEIVNAGKSALKITKLQVFNSSVGVRLKKTLLLPGQSTKLQITISPQQTINKKRRLRILMITNDPVRPKVEINIKR